MHLALCGAGGQHQQLIVGLYVHGIVVQRAGADLVDIAQEIVIGIKRGAQVVEARPVIGIVVDDDHRKHLVFIGVEQCLHGQRGRLPGVVAVNGKTVETGKHGTVVHVVAVNDGHLIGGFGGLEIIALVKKERTVLVVGLVEVVIEVIVVVPGIHDGVVDPEKIAVARLIGQPAAQILVLGIQILQ